MLDSSGRKKRQKKKPSALQCQELTKAYKPWGIPRTDSEAICKCISGTKGQCSFQGRAQYWFPAFSFKSLGPCQQTNIYFSWERESHSTQLTRVWLLGKGCFMARASQPAPKCTDLLKGFYWWWPQTDRSLWRELTSHGGSVISAVLTSTQFCQKELKSPPHSLRNLFPKCVKNIEIINSCLTGLRFPSSW